jgi:hypothetical protein
MPKMIMLINMLIEVIRRSYFARMAESENNMLVWSSFPHGMETIEGVVKMKFKYKFRKQKNGRYPFYNSTL